MSKFTLVTLQPSDVPVCVSIYFASFQNAHSLACWPRIPSVRKWWENMFLDELSEPFSHWRKAVSNETGEIAGFMKWQEPKPGQEPDENLPEWPEGADKSLCDETFGAWAKGHKRIMGNRGHWYLEIVATHPKFQGQGAGKLMLAYGCDKADEQGLESYLEASPEAVSLYEKYAFKEVDRLDTWIENERVKGSWYRNLFMVRDAQAPV